MLALLYHNTSFASSEGIRIYAYPVGRRLDVVCQSRLDVAGRDAVDADAVLRPLHGEGVRHVADGGLGAAVGGRGGGAVGAVRGHGGGKDDGALGLELDELAGGVGGAQPAARHVELVQALKLLQGEVEGGQVLGRAGVGDEAVEATAARGHLVNGALDRLLVGDVRLHELKLARVQLGQRGKVVAGLLDVEGEDLGGIVGEADLCEAETDTLVGTSD